MSTQRGTASAHDRAGASASPGPSTTTCLDVDDLAEVIGAVGLDRFVDELIEALADAVRTYDPDEVKHLTRDGFSYTTPRVGLVEWMPAMTVGDVAAIKTVAYHPDNPTAHGLPSVLATTSVYDTTDGRLLSISEATVLTALRTGAASAVMTDALVRPGPITLGVVGCGAQSVTQIHAVSRVRDIERIIVTDRDPEVAATLADRLPAGTVADGVAIEVCDVPGFEALVPELDVLCTCTSVEIDHGPVVELRQAKPSLHINAVGSDFPGKVELPIDYLRSSVVIPDAVEQCLAEGESQQLTADDLGPDMVAVLNDPANRELVSQRTVFDSTGWSYEDLVAARLFATHAEKLGLGTDLRLQHRPIDPYDPLEALRLPNGR
jgi:ornithine cyclodeaminase/alanine dehydrogenase-like protein (mu-crystallin family)